MDFDTFLDKVLETGTTITDKVFDRDIAQSQAQAEASRAAAEQARQAQLEWYQKYGVSDDGQAVTIAGYTFSSWLVPVALGIGALFFLKKVKLK